MYSLRLIVLLFLLTIEGRGNNTDTCTCISKKDQKSIFRRLRRLEEVLSRGDCPTGFVRYSRYCYLFVLGERSRLNWGGAREYCRERGANLITMDGAQQVTFITEYFRRNFKNAGEEIKLFTGLIFTDHQAMLPFDPIEGTSPHHGTSPHGDSLRWTATQAAVNNSKVNGTEATGPIAKWSPSTIQGYYTGPPGAYLSCIILKWNVDKKFDWRFNSCWGEQLHFICEVRLRKRRKRKNVKRSKREVDEDDLLQEPDLTSDLEDEPVLTSDLEDEPVLTSDSFDVDVDYEYDESFLEDYELNSKFDEVFD